MVLSKGSGVGVGEETTVDSPLTSGVTSGSVDFLPPSLKIKNPPTIKIIKIKMPKKVFTPPFDFCFAPVGTNETFSLGVSGTG